MERTHKKIEVVSLYELQEYPELWEHLDLKDDEYFEDEPLSFFKSDSDMIQLFGYTSYFKDIQIKDTLYIIVSDHVSDVEYHLESFFSNDFKNEWKMTEPNYWNSFWYNKGEVIAYRGGSEYGYTIWEFDK
jgi:hypothetical protein